MVSRKQYRIQEKFDKKNTLGLWVRSWNVTHSKQTYSNHFTLSGVRWSEMLKRCNPNSKNNQRFPRYVGCQNGFADFQEFVDWSRYEFGYDKTCIVGGKECMWHLDKDLLGADSKIYSTINCLYVPPEVNTFLCTAPAARGQWPIGVRFHKRDKVFEADCNVGGGERLHLGRFGSAMEAHAAWQKCKVETGHKLIDKYKAHKKMVEGLSAWLDKIEQDRLTDRESVFL